MSDRIKAEHIDTFARLAIVEYWTMEQRKEWDSIPMTLRCMCPDDGSIHFVEDISDIVTGLREVLAQRDEAEAIIEDMMRQAQTMATSGAKNSAKVVLETFEKAAMAVKKKRSGL